MHENHGGLRKKGLKIRRESLSLLFQFICIHKRGIYWQTISLLTYIQNYKLTQGVQEALSMFWVQSKKCARKPIQKCPFKYKAYQFLFNVADLKPHPFANFTLSQFLLLADLHSLVQWVNYRCLRRDCRWSKWQHTKDVLNFTMVQVHIRHVCYFHLSFGNVYRCVMMRDVCWEHE